MDYIIIALLSVLIILAIILLLKQGKNRRVEIKLDTLSQSVNSEFERSRRELSEQQAQMRTETSSAINSVAQKSEQMRLEFTEKTVALEGKLVKEITDMKVNHLEQSERQTRVISSAVEKMRESNEKKLDEMRATVDEKLTSTLSTRLDSSFKTVSERLENVYKSLGEMKELSSGVTSNVTALTRVLTNVKARGTWAEIQLGTILDQTIPGLYETNFLCDEKSSARVEFAVRMPTNDGNVTYLPIDSKFPMEDYIRICEAADIADAGALEDARKALESRLMTEARAISKYINVPRTTPYAIMYLATEGLYAEVVQSKTGIAEKISSQFGIMIAGPTTITALLNSLSFGFRAVAINEKANEVRELLGATKQQYDKFADLIAKARKKIDEAGKSLDDAAHRNRMIQKKLKGIDALEEVEADSVLGIEEKIFDDLEEEE